MYTIFLKGLSKALSEDQLLDLASDFGKVKRMHKSPAYALLQYANQQEASEAIEFFNSYSPTTTKCSFAFV